MYWYCALAFASQKCRNAGCIYGDAIISTSCGAANAGAKFTRNHLAIFTRSQAGLECPRQCAAIVIDNDEAFISASKCDLVAAVIPPIAGKEITDGRVTKPHHVCDGTIAMLARLAAHSLVETRWCGDIVIPGALGCAARIKGRAIAGVESAIAIKRIARHQRGIAVRPRQYKNVAQIVGRTTPAVTALIVVIIGKRNRFAARLQPPSFAKRAQISQLARARKFVFDLRPISKFSHHHPTTIQPKILIRLYRLTRRADDFKKPKGLVAPRLFTASITAPTSVGKMCSAASTRKPFTPILTRSTK